MMRLRVNASALGVWAFGLVILYMAGIALAGALFFAFLFYLFVPLLSFIVLCHTFITFHYHESFSTEHPVKNQPVTYTLLLANDTVLAPAAVVITFRSPGAAARIDLPPLDMVLKRRQSVKKTFTLTFPFRGIYEVGMERIVLSDYLHWLSYSPPVWWRTFYVYPRVIELSTVFAGLRNMIESSGAGRGIIQDYSLFRELSEYREARAVKHVAWKKYAATGNLFLREYETSSWPGIEIYLDLRREGEPDHGVLEREDCSVEILTALVNYFLKRSVRVNVHAATGHDRYEFSGREPDEFDRFFRSTITLTFAAAPSPAALFRADLEERGLASGTVVFITHTADPEILELSSGRRARDVTFFTVLNRVNVPPRETAAERDRLGREARDQGSLIFVESSDAVRENLER